MSFRVSSVLVIGAALALNVGCDHRGSEPLESTGDPGSGASATAAGSGGSSVATPVDNTPLFEWETCTVPQQFQLASYGDDAEEGTPASSGADTVPQEGVEPPSLQVGDGDLSVLVVFDKSGSMGDWWGDRTRFWAAHDALMRGVHHYIDNLTLSAILFPLETNCGAPGLESERQIPWMQAHEFVKRWDTDLCRNQPSGGTPLLQALEVADATIDEAEGLGLLEDRFRVLVLTDGEANCGATPETLIAFPKAWAQRGVETHVIGLPGSESAADVLRRMAEAGGGAYTPVPAVAPVIVYENGGQGGAGVVLDDESGGQDVLTGALDLVVK
jgi:Mg-chelatase subunit ChlD